MINLTWDVPPSVLAVSEEQCGRVSFTASNTCAASPGS